MTTTKKVGIALIAIALLWHYKSKAKTGQSLPQPSTGGSANPDNGNTGIVPPSTTDTIPEQPVLIKQPDVRLYADGAWVAYKDASGRNKKGRVEGYENSLYIIRAYLASEIDRVSKEDIFSVINL